MRSQGLGDHLEYLLRKKPPPSQAAKAASVRVSDPASERDRRPQGARARLQWTDEFKRDRTIEAVIENRSDFGMGLISPERLPPGALIIVRPLGGAPARGVVRRCGPAQGGWSVSVELSRQDKRRFARRTWERPGMIRWKLLDGSPCERAVHIEDRSEGGLCMRVPDQLAPGTVLEVRSDGWKRLARVANCRRFEDAFRAGVQFVGPSRTDDPPYVRRRGAR